MEPNISVQSWFKNNNNIWKFRNNYVIIGKELSTSPLYITINNYYLNSAWISFYRNGYPIERQKEWLETYQDLNAAGGWLTKQVKLIIKEATEICKIQRTITDMNEKITLRKGFKISVNFIPNGELLLFLVPKLEQLVKDYEQTSRS